MRRIGGLSGYLNASDSEGSAMQSLRERSAKTELKQEIDIMKLDMVRELRDMNNSISNSMTKMEDSIS